MAPCVGSKSNQQDDRQSSNIERVETGADIDRDKMAEPEEQSAIATLANDEIKQSLLKLAKLQEKALESSKWVGKNFAETARAMHYGEQDEKAVHGEVSPKEAKDLLDEGIEIAPLPLPIRRPNDEH